jgi:hypothetical protein
MARDDLGTLEAGKRADFLVLSADPLSDIANLRQLETVVIGGRRFDAGALRAALAAPAG